MRITRSIDPDLIDELVLGSGQGAVDLGQLVDSEHVYALVGEPAIGTHICMRVIEGVYEVHSAVLPDGRGEWAQEFTAAAVAYMFCATDCVELITRLPQGSLAAATLARRFGFKPRWSGVMRLNGRDIPYGVWSLTLFEWLPAELEAHQAVIKRMLKTQPLKAAAWDTRRNFVSRRMDS